MPIKYKTISEKEYNMMKKLGYINKGKDGITRGIFYDKKKGGTVSTPVKKRRSK